MRLERQRGFAGGGFRVMPTHSPATKPVPQVFPASGLVAWMVLARCRRNISRASWRST
jgi:hypothetical protein